MIITIMKNLLIGLANKKTRTWLSGDILPVFQLMQQGCFDISLIFMK